MIILTLYLKILSRLRKKVRIIIKNSQTIHLGHRGHTMNEGNMNDGNWYKVNEIASLHDLSRKTLLHYDKIGLFKPEYVDELNGYRYYHRQQLPMLKEIIYLKKIGFTLDKIKTLLDNRTHPTIIEALELRQKELSEQIQSLKQQEDSIHYLLDFYYECSQLSENDLYRPSIKMYPSRRLHIGRCEKEGSRKEVMFTYRKALQQLNTRNLFSHYEYGTVYFNEDQEAPLTDRVGVFIRLPEEFDVPDAQIISAGKYICMYKKGGYYDEESLNYFLSWINENGYTIEGDIYDFCRIDYTFTKNEDEMIQELQVKVK